MLRRGGGRSVILRHALFEAFDALGDIAHHVGKAALAEQQQDQNPDDQPVPAAQTTHLNISLSRPYKNCAIRMHVLRSKNATKLLRRLLLGPVRPSLPRTQNSRASWWARVGKS